MVFIQLIALLILCSSIIALSPRRFHSVISLVGGCVAGIEIFSILINGRFIDERFFFHIESDTNPQLFSQFILPILISIVGIAVYFRLSIIVGNKLRLFRKDKYSEISLLTISLFLMFLPSGIINQLYHSRSFIIRSHDTNLEKAVKEAGLKNNQFNPVSSINAQSGKNIIVIMLESFERGYLEDPLRHLTPHLQYLKKEYNYIPFNESYGSDWTAGSIYTMMTGMPCFFNKPGNEIFNDVKDTRIISIGHILTEAGYNLRYLIGNPSYGGIDNMLKSFQIDVVSESSFPNKYPTNPWGLYDIDVFTEAKSQIDELSADNKPFALFINTIGTHPPDGIRDKRMKELVEPLSSNLKTNIKATDFLINDLITHLQNNSVLENTTFYILPDHLLLGNMSPILAELKNDRGLFMITNGSINNDSELNHKIELPRFILDRAGVNHNIEFLCDVIDPSDYDEVIQEKKEALRTVNITAWALDKTKFPEVIVLKSRLSGIDVASKIEIQYASPIDTTFCIYFDQDFNTSFRMMTSPFSANNYWHNSSAYKLIITHCDDKTFTQLERKDGISISASGSYNIVFTKDDLKLLYEWPDSKNHSTLSIAREYQPQDNTLLVTSSVTGEPQILTPTLASNKNRKYAFSSLGLYLISSDSFLHLPLRPGPDILDQFKTRMEEIRRQDEVDAVILIHGRKPELTSTFYSEMGLPGLAFLPPDQAYIAFKNGDTFEESTKLYSLSMALSFKDNTIERNGSKDIIVSPDKMIAHAGGMIDGHNYTNSREALDQSYRKGFRKFELDIIKTSDDHYVAAHDWNMWKEMTGYSGIIPPDLDTFNRYKKLLGKYHSMDMAEINDWFITHKDAILITDKVNDPLDFSRQFIAPDRLQMELFTWDAIEVARTNNIDLLCNDQLLIREKSPVTKLKKHGIDKVAISKNYIFSHPQLFNQLSNSSIKTYIFHINQPSDQNERYFYENYGHVFYGMYADDWSF